jgi:predicted GIY-YIG superfamily endonuclease
MTSGGEFSPPRWDYACKGPACSWSTRGGAMQTRRQYFVYHMTNKWNRVLHTGVTSDLRRRVEQHQSTLGGGFSAKYGLKKLVYYEVYGDPVSAIARE